MFTVILVSGFMCLEFVWLTCSLELMLAIERPINWLLLVRTILIIMLIFESTDALFYMKNDNEYPKLLVISFPSPHIICISFAKK